MANTTKTARVKVPNVVVPITLGPSKRSKRNRNRKKGGKSRVTSAGGLSSLGFSASYAACLNNPFEFPPIQLGLGSFIATRLGTAYVRQSLTVNADGSFQAWLSPTQVTINAGASVGGFLMCDTVGQGSTPTFSIASNANDRAALQTDFDQLRVIGAAMKVWALQARTSAPGIFVSGQYSPDSGNVIPNSTLSGPLSVTSLQGLPLSEFSTGYEPIMVSWRPEEINRFNFEVLNEASNAGSEALGPAVYVAGFGFPAGTNVWVEGIAHYEGYVSAHTSAQAGANNVNVTAADAGFPSVDSLWNSAKTLLTPVTTRVSEVAIEGAQAAAINIINTMQRRLNADYQMPRRLRLYH